MATPILPVDALAAVDSDTRVKVYATDNGDRILSGFVTVVVDGMPATTLGGVEIHCSLSPEGAIELAERLIRGARVQLARRR